MLRDLVVAPPLGELAFSIFLIFFYKKGSQRYPGKWLGCKSDADLHFSLLSFLLAYTFVLWIANLYTLRSQLKSSWQTIYDILNLEGASPIFKWGWMSYCLLILSFQLFKWRSAIKRMRRQTPIVKIQQESKLVAYLREKRRQRKLRATQAEIASPGFPQDLKVDLENLITENEETNLLSATGSTEPTESTTTILLSNAQIRRRRAHVALYSQWIHLVIVGYCLVTQLQWNDHVGPAWRTFIDIFCFGYMVVFPIGWIETLITTLEAAVDQREGERAEGTVQI